MKQNLGLNIFVLSAYKDSKGKVIISQWVVNTCDPHNVLNILQPWLQWPFRQIGFHRVPAGLGNRADHGAVGNICEAGVWQVYIRCQKPIVDIYDKLISESNGETDEDRAETSTQANKPKRLLELNADGFPLLPDITDQERYPLDTMKNMFREFVTVHYREWSSSGNIIETKEIKQEKPDTISHWWFHG
jgi:hypothetical protein